MIHHWQREWDFPAYANSHKPSTSPCVLQIRPFQVDTLRKLLELRHQKSLSLSAKAKHELASDNNESGCCCEGKRQTSIFIFGLGLRTITKCRRRSLCGWATQNASWTEKSNSSIPLSLSIRVYSTTIRFSVSAENTDTFSSECENSLIVSCSAHASFYTVRLKPSTGGTRGETQFRVEGWT